jgi:LPXTG-motif cell wall-anchored protein
MTAPTTLARRAAATAGVLLLAVVGVGAFTAPAAAQDGGVAYPFVHSDLSFTGVEPGESLSVTPTLFQEDPLPDDTAALIVNYWGSAGPGFLRDDVRTDVPYDNCAWGMLYPQTIYCIVTEFEDLAGSAIAPTVPVTYAISETTPGPIDICRCGYRVFAVDAAVLERDFGYPTWDPDSENLLGLEAVDAWDGPSSVDKPRESGRILAETTEHPYDLEVEDLAFAGAAGEEISAPLPVGNLGLADTLLTVEVPGSVTVRGELPDGLQFLGVEIADDPYPEWTCLSEDDELAQEYARIGDATELHRLDFACFTHPIDTDDARGGLRLTVKITDPDAVAGGMIETDVVDYEGWPGNLESDLANNRSDIVVTVEDAAAPPPRLPATGMSTTMPLAAMTTLVLGTALLVLARRRRDSAA